MAYGQAAFADKALNCRAKLQESQRVGDHSPALAHFGRHFLLLKLELFDQLRIALSFLHRIEIFPLEIFNQGELEHRPVVCLAKDYRNLRQTEQLSCAPAALSGDQFQMIITLSDNKRLDDPLLTDRVSQFPQSLRREIFSGLERAGADAIQRD